MVNKSELCNLNLNNAICAKIPSNQCLTMLTSENVERRKLYYGNYAAQCHVAKRIPTISLIASSVCHFSGRLASARERLGESRISPANVLGVDRDRVAIRITFACGARRRKELPGGRCRISGGEGKLVTFPARRIAP